MPLLLLFKAIKANFISTIKWTSTYRSCPDKCLRGEFQRSLHFLSKSENSELFVLLGPNVKQKVARGFGERHRRGGEETNSVRAESPLPSLSPHKVLTEHLWASQTESKAEEEAAGDKWSGWTKRNLLSLSLSTKRQWEREGEKETHGKLRELSFFFQTQSQHAVRFREEEEEDGAFNGALLLPSAWWRPDEGASPT